MGDNLVGPFANLYGADLTGADLSDADLSAANLTGANLMNVNLANTNLTGATLENADLKYAGLTDADLRYANLEGTNLHGATLFRVDLSNAWLNYADLSYAFLIEVALSGANLTSASLSYTDFTDAIVTDADFTDTHWHQTIWTDGVIYNTNTNLHYGIFEVWSTEGNFAPDPNQDQETVAEALTEIIEDPLQIQKTLQNLSWSGNRYSFYIESEWESTFIILLLSVDYSIGGGIDPSEGPAGTLDFTVTDPDGTNHVYGKDGDGYEIVTWNNQLDERPLLLPVIGGTWTITISGSGLEGIGSILYSGDYSIRIESDKLE